jgi:hypothetical protein
MRTLNAHIELCVGLRVTKPVLLERVAGANICSRTPQKAQEPARSKCKYLSAFWLTD